MKGPPSTSTWLYNLYYVGFICYRLCSVFASQRQDVFWESVLYSCETTTARFLMLLRYKTSRDYCKMLLSETSRLINTPTLQPVNAALVNYPHKLPHCLLFVSSMPLTVVIVRKTILVFHYSCVVWSVCRSHKLMKSVNSFNSSAALSFHRVLFSSPWFLTATTA